MNVYVLISQQLDGETVYPLYRACVGGAEREHAGNERHAELEVGRGRLSLSYV